jgi:hypothetical protein
MDNFVSLSGALSNLLVDEFLTLGVVCSWCHMIDSWD